MSKMVIPKDKMNVLSVWDKIENGYLLTISAQEYATANGVSLTNYNMRIVQGGEHGIASKGIQMNAEVIIGINVDNSGNYVGTALIPKVGLEKLVDQSEDK